LFKQKQITLDIGCGYNYHGEINADLYIHKTLHRVGTHLKLKEIPNFVLCDCSGNYHLPFKNNAVSIVSAYEVLEHKGIKPIKLIKEMLRVASFKIIIETPTIFSNPLEFSAHARVFSKRIYDKIFKQFNRDIYYIMFFPLKKWFPFFAMPKGIHVEIFLSNN